MAYNAPRKKKEWWETALQAVGRVADKVIPGDQSSWHQPSRPSQPTRASQPAPSRPAHVGYSAPQAQRATQQRQASQPVSAPSNDFASQLTQPLGVSAVKQPRQPEPTVSPLDVKAIDDRLDKGYSWEQISKETGSDLNRVKQHSQQTRPGYGVAQKPQQAPQQAPVRDVNNYYASEYNKLKAEQAKGDDADGKHIAGLKQSLSNRQKELTAFSKSGYSKPTNTGLTPELEEADRFKAFGADQNKQTRARIAQKDEEQVKAEREKLGEYIRTRGDQKLYSSSVNDIINRYNNADVSAQTAIRKELADKASLNLTYGDEDTMNKRDEASLFLKALDLKGRNKTSIKQSAANLGGEILSGLADLGMNVSDSARLVTTGKGTLTDVNEDYKSGAINKDEYIKRSNEATNRMSALTGGSEDRGMLDRAMRSAATGVDVATTVVPIGTGLRATEMGVKAAKGAAPSFLNRGLSKVVDKRVADMLTKDVAGTTAGSVKGLVGREAALNSAFAGAGSFREGTDTTFQDFADQAALGGALGGTLAGGAYGITRGVTTGASKARDLSDNLHDTLAERSVRNDPQSGFIPAAVQRELARQRKEIERGNQEGYLTREETYNNAGQGYTPTPAPKLAMRNEVDDALDNVIQKTTPVVAPIQAPIEAPITTKIDEPAPQTTGLTDNYKIIDETPAPSESLVKIKNTKGINASSTLERLRQRAANPIEETPLHAQFGVKPDTVERLVRDYGEEQARGALIYMDQARADGLKPGNTPVKSPDAFVVGQAKKMFKSSKVRITNNEPKTLDETVTEANVTPEGTVRIDNDVPQALRVDESDPAVLETQVQEPANVPEPIRETTIDDQGRTVDLVSNEVLDAPLIKNVEPNVAPVDAPPVRDQTEVLTPEDVEMVRTDVQNALDEAGFDDAQIVEVAHIGSTKNGKAHDNSDIDMLVTYNGTAREDDVFNALQEYVEANDLTMNGRKLDFNPIRADDVDAIASLTGKPPVRETPEYVDTPEGRVNTATGEIEDSVPPMRATAAEERSIDRKLAEEKRIEEFQERNSTMTAQQERQLAEQEPGPVAPTPTGYDPVYKPVREPIQTEAQLGSIAKDFYDNKQGNQKITYRDLKNIGDTVAARVHNSFLEIGSNLSTVARTIQQQVDKGVKDVDKMTGLTPQEKTLWKGLQSEQDYIRRRASLGGKEIGGDQGDSYWHRTLPENRPTEASLFQDFLSKSPGSEKKRRSDEFALKADEISYSPQVISKYIIEHGDTKLLQEERIYRAIEKDNPGVDESKIRDAARKMITIQDRINKQQVKMRMGVGKKVTVTEGEVVDMVEEMNQMAKILGKEMVDFTGNPKGLTNGAHLNSVSIVKDGKTITLADHLGMNQFRDTVAYAFRQTRDADGDREVLATMVNKRLTEDYDLTPEEINYATESVSRIKTGIDENIVAARVDGVYRNAAKQQLLRNLQTTNIHNPKVKKEVSDIVKQIVREGSTESALSAKIVQKTLRAQNALFRKLNVSSALNELSDITSFVNMYGHHTKILKPDFKLVKDLGLGEIDPAIQPYLNRIENGEDTQVVLKALKKLNNGTRFYKFVETYKAGVLANTAKTYYANPKNGGLTGDALTARVLKDYRDFALPVDMFTKTALDDYPLFTQYMTWGVRNLEKEGKMALGQFDAGVMQNKSQKMRVIRNLYANIPAKTAFWLASNGLKGTSFMTAFGLTDFTGLTNQDFSGIQEEDKNLYDRTTQWTNMSTTLSLLNTSIQALEKEGLKEKYKDADYNPYENAHFTESFINTYTPQFMKNALGGYDLNQRGYSDTNNSVLDQANRALGGKPDESNSRVQYEAPQDTYNKIKSFALGKNQTDNAREYSGRENLVGRMNKGDSPVKAISDMFLEQVGGKESNYTRPITDEYTKAYKDIGKGVKGPELSQSDREARTAMLKGGREYNGYLDKLKKDSPELYKRYIDSMDDHVNPEMWKARSTGKDGKPDLTIFNMIKDRKKQLEKDFGTKYDPMYDLSDEQASAVLRYKATPTGEDIAARNILKKEQWYLDLKEKQSKFYAENETKNSGEYTKTDRVKEWEALDDKLSSFYTDADSVAKNGPPAWAEQFPLVFQRKQLTYGTPEWKAFNKAHYDEHEAQKEGYDKAQLEVINQMRKIEGEEPMSWEAYQQAKEVVDTDPSDDEEDGYKKSGWVNYKKNGGKGGGGSSGGDSYTKPGIGPDAGVSFNAAGQSSGVSSIKIKKAPSVKINPRHKNKKIAIKRGGKTK